MISRVRIRGFRAHADTKLELGRFTVLVGDNASGKTSVLDALRVVGACAASSVPSLPSNLYPPDLFARNGDDKVVLDCEGSTDGEAWSLSFKLTERVGAAREPDPWLLVVSGEVAGHEFRRAAAFGPVHGNASGATGALPELFGAVGAYSLQPEKIAAAAHSDETDARVEFDGTNTAVVLASMKLGDDPNFDRIAETTRQLIPSVERIRIQRAPLPNRANSLVGNKIHFDFHGASDVPAHAASQGTLIVLSLLTILYAPNRPRLILLDDLDHALHPRAQMELVKVLQHLVCLPEFANLQIVATTHSPYVLDMVQPADIYAFAMRPDGTSASKRLSEHPAAAKSAGTLASGQLWSLDPERDWVLRDDA